MPSAPVDSAWLSHAARLAHALSAVPGTSVARYRFGDGLLEIEADRSPVVDELARQYGECAAAATDSRPEAVVRCSVSTSADGRFALIRFRTPADLDAAAIALDLLQHPIARPLYAEREATADGWRVIGATAQGSRPFLAARGAQALIDLELLRPGFLVELVMSPVLSLQKQLLFVHAAAIGIRGAGTLLIGPSGSGKTTLSLALAARGHAFFGDDVAAIRIASTELLPFRRTASIRPGPHASALAELAAPERFQSPLYTDGKPRIPIQVATQFPASVSQPLRLHRVLFLRRFAARPRIEPFLPTLTTLGAQPELSLNNLLWLAWGTSPERRLLQFLLFVRMLARLQCAFLEAGTPDATADLIESLAEDIWA